VKIGGDNLKLISMHIPVLLKEAINGLNISRGKIIVDATLGDGGHSKEILKKLEKGILVAIDIDQAAIRGCQTELEALAKENNNQIFFVNDNFSNLDSILKKLDISKVDGILADLGWRVEQIENEAYGMSFRLNSKLDMRLGRNGGQTKTATDIINDYEIRELERIFRIYGEERHAHLVARKILEKRRSKKIENTVELAEIIEGSIGRYYSRSKIHPATRIFQALRIEVNSEIENLKIFLERSLEYLTDKGRMAVISFHSLEDREVKKFFQTNARGCICPKESPICFCGRRPKLNLITKKPIRPSEEELEKNKKSRSAKLRIIEKTKNQ